MYDSRYTSGSQSVQLFWLTPSYGGFLRKERVEKGALLLYLWLLAYSYKATGVMKCSANQLRTDEVFEIWEVRSADVYIYQASYAFII